MSNPQIDIAAQVAAIRSAEKWPNPPVLPVKNIVDPTGPTVGVILEAQISTVWLVNMWDIDRTTAPIESLVFPTVKDMVTAGWIAD